MFPLRHANYIVNHQLILNNNELFKKKLKKSPQQDLNTHYRSQILRAKIN